MQGCVAVLIEPADEANYHASNVLNRLLTRAAKAVRDRVSMKRQLPSGAHVAAESLTEALITHGSAGRCHLFLLPGTQLWRGEKFARLTRVSGRPLDLRVRPYHELVSALANGEISLWFDPHGALWLPLEARQGFSHSVFPIVSTFHHLNFPGMLYPWVLRGLLAGGYPCDSIVCPSLASQKALVRVFEQVSGRMNQEFGGLTNFRQRVDVIPTCVDTARFRPCDKHRVRRDHGLPKDRPIILYAGRLSIADKGDLAPLVIAFRDLARADPRLDPLLLIAGPDRKGEQEAIRRMVSLLAIEDNVRLMGSVPREEMRLILASADVFVSPSDTVQENLPLTLLEAMACGVPQIAPDWDGYRDAVKHGESGFLVPTYWTRCDRQLSAAHSLLGWEFDYLTLSQSVAIDIGAMKKYLGMLIANEKLRLDMGRKSRQRAERLYSYTAIIGQYESLWQELLEAARSLSIYHRKARFNEPTYFDWFAHFASSLLDDQTRLIITPLGCEVSKQGRIPLPYESLKQLNILNERVIGRLLGEFAEPTEMERGPGPLGRRQTTPISHELGELVSHFAHRDGCQEEDVRRHLMWLLKYGLVEVAV